MSAVEEWPLARVMQSVHKSCDFGRLSEPEDWLGMISYKIKDPSATALIDEIGRHGFLDPITLRPCDEYCGTCEGTGFQVGNGHHRLAVAVLLGLDTIKIQKSRSIFGDNSNDHDYATASNPHRNDSDDRNWLATQVVTDVNGDDIDVSEPHENETYGDGGYRSPSDNACHCTECRPAESESSESTPSESSDHDATERYDEFVPYSPYGDAGRWTADHNLAYWTQQAFIPVEVPGQLALA